MDFRALGLRWDVAGAGLASDLASPIWHGFQIVLLQ
jgi:hypothetical protein